MNTSFIKLFLLVLFLNQNVIGQQLPDLIKITDPTLHNGRVYNFISLKTLGHQFLHSETFKIGTVTIDDISYTNQLLNYDIFNQELLLKFDLEGAKRIISVPKETVSSFSVDNQRFVVLHTSNWDYTIYEIIGDDQLHILYHWTKEIKVSNKDEVHDYEYSKAKKSSYLYYSGKLTRIKNKKDFLNAFGDQKKREIKKFMREKRLRFRSAPNDELSILLNYCKSV